MLCDRLPVWTLLSPLAGWLLLAASWFVGHPLLVLALGAVLVACVLAAVHHAEVVAHRVGEPFGTLVMALAVTVIEVALIVSLMLASGDAAAALARDTIFAAIMIILNGMVGLCLLVGGSRHGEQAFGLYGVNAALATLATMAAITLILPNTTTTIAGPMYSASQLVLIAVVSLVLYGSFVLVQTIRHRDYFCLTVMRSVTLRRTPCRQARWWRRSARLCFSLASARWCSWRRLSPRPLKRQSMRRARPRQ
jgi:Ca2+:H+ antiporter